MAFMEIDFPEDLLTGLLETEADRICEEALKAAAPVLEREMKAAAARVIEHPGDSEMVESIRARKPVKAKNGAWIVNVCPTGKSTHFYTAKDERGRRTRRKYPVSNVLKAIWKNYGIAGRQPARPFLTAAINNARAKGLQMIQETYDRMVGG